MALGTPRCLANRADAPFQGGSASAKAPRHPGYGCLEVSCLPHGCLSRWTASATGPACWRIGYQAMAANLPIPIPPRHYTSAPRHPGYGCLEVSCPPRGCLSRWTPRAMGPACWRIGRQAMAANRYVPIPPRHSPGRALSSGSISGYPVRTGRCHPHLPKVCREPPSRHLPSRCGQAIGRGLVGSAPIAAAYRGRREFCGRVHPRFLLGHRVRDDRSKYASWTHF